MKPLSSLAAVLALLTPLGGCSVWRYARLVCVQEPKLYCEKVDDEASMALYRSWADQAWAEVDGCPDSCNEADYGWGFREGFAQTVYAGGDGQPPALPPRPYWQTDLRNAEGARAAQSWFEGYRHGARVARDGGYRKCAVLRVSASLADCGPCGCPDQKTCPLAPAPEGPHLAAPSDGPVEVILPLPTDEGSSQDGRSTVPPSGEQPDQLPAPAEDRQEQAPLTLPLPLGGDSPQLAVGDSQASRVLWDGKASPAYAGESAEAASANQRAFFPIVP